MLKRILLIAALICLATAPAWAQSAQNYNCDSYNPNPAGQFCINTGSGSTWVYPSGDLTYTYGILCSPTHSDKCGAYTVRGLNGEAFNGTLANGQTWCFNSADGFLEPCTVGSGTLAGVVVGPSGASLFNSTNTAGNLESNAHIINNQGHNIQTGGYFADLEIKYDTVTGDNQSLIRLDTGNGDDGVGVMSAISPTLNGVVVNYEANDNTGSTTFGCASPEVFGDAGDCSLSVGSVLKADNITSTTDASPTFSFGVGIAITIASGYPPCDGGENLNAPGFVVDADSCADGVQPTNSGSGGTHCPVFCDGVKWRALYTVATSTPLPSPTPTPTPTPAPTATP